jgi:hypothetical protein
MFWADVQAMRIKRHMRAYAQQATRLALFLGLEHLEQ